MDVVPDNLLNDNEMSNSYDNVFGTDLLHIAAYGWGGVHNLVHQELVENRCLPCVVQTNQTNLVL